MLVLVRYAKKIERELQSEQEKSFFALIEAMLKSIVSRVEAGIMVKRLSKETFVRIFRVD